MISDYLVNEEGTHPPENPIAFLGNLLLVVPCMGTMYGLSSLNLGYFIDKRGLERVSLFAE